MGYFDTYYNVPAIKQMSDSEFREIYEGKKGVNMESLWMHCNGKKLRNGRNHKKGKKGSEAGHSDADSPGSEESKD